MKTLSRNLASLFKPVALKKPGQLHRAARQKTKRLAATLHVQIETFKGESGLNVRPTKRIDVDPFDGDHYAQDWTDALQRVQAYSEFQALIR